MERGCYKVGEGWGENLQPANFLLCGDFWKPVKVQMSNDPGSVTGEGSRNFLDSLHKEDRVWWDHHCICAKAKGFITAPHCMWTLFGISTLRTGHCWQTTLNGGIYSLVKIWVQRLAHKCPIKVSCYHGIHLPINKGSCWELCSLFCLLTLELCEGSVTECCLGSDWNAHTYLSVCWGRRHVGQEARLGKHITSLNPRGSLNKSLWFRSLLTSWGTEWKVGQFL